MSAAIKVKVIPPLYNAYLLGLFETNKLELHRKSAIL